MTSLVEKMAKLQNEICHGRLIGSIPLQDCFAIAMCLQKRMANFVPESKRVNSEQAAAAEVHNMRLCHGNHFATAPLASKG